MLLARGERWLLSVRGAEARYAPGALGLIGGHLEPTDVAAGEGLDVLRTTACRELAEEAGVMIPESALRYLESTLFDDGSRLQLSVTFVAPAPAELEAMVGAPDELAEVGWWTVAEAAADPRCPEWLPALLVRANRLSR